MTLMEGNVLNARECVLQAGGECFILISHSKSVDMASLTNNQIKCSFFLRVKPYNQKKYS